VFARADDADSVVGGGRLFRAIAHL
jgi:hypothetical protein